MPDQTRILTAESDIPEMSVHPILPHGTQNFAPMGEWAKRYACNGWRVFPLHAGRKDPRIKNWQNAASVDPAAVTAWWTAFPDSGIGLVLDGLACLDIDPRNGGTESLAALEAEHGALDPCARQRSGGGGWHYLFEVAGGVATSDGFKPGLDYLTGANHYICVEPSIHPSGGVYQWDDSVNPLAQRRDQIPLVVPPGWLLEAANGKKLKVAGHGKRPGGFLLPDVIPHGVQETTMTRFAGYLRRAGTDTPSILAALKLENMKRCQPLMADADLSRIASSIGRKEPAPMDEVAGLTQALAVAILASDHFARDKGGLLYAWQDGVYRPTGQRIVDRRVKSLCEEWEKTKGWSPELSARVGAWIAVDAPELWERPPLDVLNCANGLLNVDTRILAPHSPLHLSPVQIPVIFDPQATCPQIDQFVSEVFPEDALHLSAEVAGWLMLPEVSIQKAVLLMGEGSNGKSVWLTLLLHFLGRENVSSLSLNKIEADKFAAARLVGKLCNIGADLPEKELVSTSLFKALTGGDPITAERKYEPSFEFQPFVRLVFSANLPPRSNDNSHGFFRRWLVILFNRRTFSEIAPDTVKRAVLDARLSEPGELSGMLNKALDALPAIRKGRFTESASTRAALDEFRRTTDPLAIWLDQFTIEHPDGMIVKDKLRNMYGQVCQDSGRPIMPDNQFTAALKRLRPKVRPGQRRVNGKPTHVFLGLGFVIQDPDGGLF